MSSAWKTWPHTRWGWISLVFAGVAIVLWGSLPVVVQVREGLKLEPQTGLFVVVALGILTVLAVVLGWVSIGLKRDRSVLLLIASCMVSGILVLAIGGEVIEGILMSRGVISD